jgi:hypothetical protein
MQNRIRKFQALTASSAEIPHIKAASYARFGYPTGGLDISKEYKKLLSFVYVKIRIVSRAVKWLW